MTLKSSPGCQHSDSGKLYTFDPKSNKIRQFKISQYNSVDLKEPSVLLPFNTIHFRPINNYASKPQTSDKSPSDKCLCTPANLTAVTNLNN